MQLVIFCFGEIDGANYFILLFLYLFRLRFYNLGIGGGGDHGDSGTDLRYRNMDGLEQQTLGLKVDL